MDRSVYARFSVGRSPVPRIYFAREEIMCQAPPFLLSRKVTRDVLGFPTLLSMLVVIVSTQEHSAESPVTLSASRANSTTRAFVAPNTLFRPSSSPLDRLGYTFLSSPKDLSWSAFLYRT